MRTFERAVDVRAIPGVHLVARVDGRSFTRLLREVHRFEPFDERVRDIMGATAEHLMRCGFRTLFAYTQSDEISVWIHPQDDAFGRRLSKLQSILAGEASARFSLLLGSMGTFDCRISQLPDLEAVVDYFRWRAGDAERNALNTHAWWTLRREGKGVREAAETLRRMDLDDRRRLLADRGRPIEGAPAWHRRGVGVYWRRVPHVGTDPRSGAKTTTVRTRLFRDLELPGGAALQAFVRERAGAGIVSD
ncbi:MAG: tRNA(His) guanylyltransferase Thg1 family protein [Myxococcaceae bacterium]